MNWLSRWSATPDLATWEQRPFSTTVEQGPRLSDNRDNHERVIGIEEPGPPSANGVARRVADAILRFDVFPPWMLSTWARRRPVEVGDTIGLRYGFLPGLDIFFAARVISRFEETTASIWRCGFTYCTLDGHPECGEETFVVEKALSTGQVTAALRSWSRPGILLVKLGYPIVRPLQLRAGRAALDHLEGIAHPEVRPVAAAPFQAFTARRNLRTNFLRSDRL